MNHVKYAGLPQSGRAENEYCPITVFLSGLFAHCKEGKKDANLKVRNTVADVKADLERLNGTAPKELQYQHLAIAEQSLPDVGFRYAVLHRDNKPVMFVYFQVFTLTSKNFNLHKDKTFIKSILRLFLHVNKARVLVLGNALRTETQSYCYDNSLLTQQDALDALATVTERIASDECITATILPGMNELMPENATTFGRMGYATPWEDNVMNMAIDPAWTTMQDYTAALTRKYKTRANKVLTGAQRLTARQLNEEEVAEYQPEINRLFAEVIDKQSFVFTTSGAAYIGALKQLYKEGFEVTGFFMEDRLVAFCSAFVRVEAYEVFYVGFDTELNCECPLYFNMLLAALERAIVLGKKELKLGRTSFDAKASLGAKASRNDYYIKFRNLPDVAMKWFASYFSAIEDNKWKLRNPLKG